MKFGEIPLSEAEGAVLAHSRRAGERLFRKGRVLSAEDIAVLRTAGIDRVVVAQFETGDVPENEAATRIATLVAGEGVRANAAFTGRVNLYAEVAGLALIHAARVDTLNAIHESITLATVAPFVLAEPRAMLATIKIIPFAAPREAIERAEKLLNETPLVSVAPFVAKRTALISTHLPDTKPQLLDKNRNVIAARLKALGSDIAFEARTEHETKKLADALSKAAKENTDPILVFGASAITDRHDVIPAAITRAGGEILHFGMPVDPGNLLLIGKLGGATVVGLPGCARSPKLNGFDFVLRRLCANLPVTAREIAGMGVGGLLTEIASRPQPREDDAGPPHTPRIAAIVLAAGLSSRMGHNKLLADVDGKPLIRRTVESALASGASPVIVVTGNEADRIEKTLADLPIQFMNNPDFSDGLSTSLKCGIRNIGTDSDGAVVILGDMPSVSADLIARLIAAFDPAESRAICVATHKGKRGNPVLWARRFFPEILALEGDVGAKHIIAANDELVCEVEAEDDAPLLDIDTPEDLAAYAARAK